MATTPRFEQWVDSFESSQQGKAALDRLARAFPKDREHLSNSLRLATLKSCFGARMYDPVGDPRKAALAKRRNLVTVLRSHKQQVSTLHTFVTSKGLAPELTKLFAYLQFKGSNLPRDRTPATAVQVTELLDSTLAGLGAALEDAIEYFASTSKNALDRHLHGCLIYPEPLDKGKQNNLVGRATMLLFDLVQLFNIREQGIERDVSATMPKKRNRRLTPIAMAFVSATLNKTVSEDSFRVFLRSNPGIAYYRWPDQPED